MSDNDVPMIYRSAHDKARALLADPERYFRILRAQRRAEFKGKAVPSDAEALRGDA